jgi:hypothetical protein
LCSRRTNKTEANRNFLPNQPSNPQVAGSIPAGRTMFLRTYAVALIV